MKVVCFPVLASVTSKALGQRRLARAWMQVTSSMYVVWNCEIHSWQLFIENPNEFAINCQCVHCLDADEDERWPEFSLKTVLSGHLGRELRGRRAFGADPCDLAQDPEGPGQRALREANIYEPQRYRHLVSSIKLLKERGEALDVAANFWSCGRCRRAI